MCLVNSYVEKLDLGNCLDESYGLFNPPDLTVYRRLNYFLYQGAL